MFVKILDGGIDATMILAFVSALVAIGVLLFIGYFVIATLSQGVIVT